MAIAADRSKKGLAGLEVQVSGEVCIFRLWGALDCSSSAPIWRQVSENLLRHRPQKLLLDCSALTYCDGAGLALFMQCHNFQRESGHSLKIQNLPKKLKSLFSLYSPMLVPPSKKRAGAFFNLIDLPTQLPLSLGLAIHRFYSKFKQRVLFVGEFLFHFIYILIHPSSLRWRDFFQIMEDVGVAGLGIIVLVGFLEGMILAFQATTVLGLYGGDIYVTNLVALSLFRELGPLTTMIIIAGRTGSSFAAELGSMKINEELDAMTTMGIRPVRFLVVPRTVAVVLMAPLLTMFFNLAGLLGTMLVVSITGFPIAAFFNQLSQGVDTKSVALSIFKPLVFGFLVGFLSCYRGLAAGLNSRAVGHAATKSMIDSVIFVVIADGFFAVLFYIFEI